MLIARLLLTNSQNPIITADMVPFNCRGVFNGSVVKHEDRYVMVLRCEGYNFYNFFVLAESPNGLDDRTIGEIIAQPEDAEYKKYARVQYDPRITKVGDTYCVTYCAHGSDARMALLSSKNMRDFKYEGFITSTGFRDTLTLQIVCLHLRTWSRRTAASRSTMALATATNASPRHPSRTYSTSR